MAILNLRSCSLCPSRYQQDGVALVVTLLILLLTAMLALVAVRGVNLQNSMTSNFYDRSLAFEATEASLREAENKIQTNTAQFRDCSPTSNKVCGTNPFANDANISANDIQTASFDGGALAAAPPQYVIDYMGIFPIPDPNVDRAAGSQSYGDGNVHSKMIQVYRITARSGSPDTTAGRAVVVLQSVFRT